MKGLFLGIVLIIVVGFGGLVYRNAVEHPSQPIACPMDARMCPDGTSVARTGLSCTFPACPLPNVTLADINVSFALPEGFTAAELPDASSVAAYESASSTADIPPSSIIIRRFALQASSTALATIRETAIGSPSGLPVSATSFTSTVLGTHRFTIASIERFEGMVDTAYYLARSTDVLRFDAIDRSVMNWTDPSLDTATLPAAVALRRLLTTLQGE
ncbi:MAG: hypothetical protein PHD04_00450 [Candidatus Pacebacteria bacterium]|nr:hypothetical protein [Candidatus Paceibacterota bacterium]